MEHLILRFIKFLSWEKPSGAFSHRDTLKALEQLAADYNVSLKEATRDVCLELMAFRHVATKIYGFLIDETKLNVIVARVENSHSEIVEIFQQLLAAVQREKNG